MSVILKDRALRHRAEAEAAADWREKQERPADRLGFYLRQLQTVLSHLVDVAMGIGTVSPRAALGGWNVFTYAQVAIERAAREEENLHQHDHEWRGLWEKLKSAFVCFQRWEGESAKAAQLAKVIFVAAFVLRLAHEAGRDCEPSGEERGFLLCAGEIPFQLDVPASLAHQLKVVAQNLEWFDEQMRCDVVWPRWW